MVMTSPLQASLERRRSPVQKQRAMVASADCPVRPIFAKLGIRFANFIKRDGSLMVGRHPATVLIRVQIKEKIKSLMEVPATAF